MKGTLDVFLVIGSITMLCAVGFGIGLEAGKRSSRDEVLAICKTKETMVVETDYVTLVLSCEVRK